MKKIIVAVLMMVGATTAFCQDWINIADNKDVRLDGRAGTREFSKTKAGKPIVVIQGRTFTKNTSAYSYEKWYIAVDDCKAGYGKLVTLTMEGEYKFENDTVLKGGSMASAISDVLCYPVLEQEKKGI